MSTAQERTGKAGRIELRLSDHAKSLLTAAALAKHTTVSEFLLTHGIAAAERVVSDPRVFIASEGDWEIIQNAMLNREPSPNINDILARYKKGKERLRL